MMDNYYIDLSNISFYSVFLDVSCKKLALLLLTLLLKYVIIVDDRVAQRMRF